MKFEPRRNLFFVFYTERGMNDQSGIPNFWVMPSVDVALLAVRNKSGSNEGRYRIDLPKVRTGSKFQRFAHYLGDNGFAALRSYRHPSG